MFNKSIYSGVAFCAECLGSIEVGEAAFVQSALLPLDLLMHLRSDLNSNGGARHVDEGVANAQWDHD